MMARLARNGRQQVWPCGMLKAPHWQVLAFDEAMERLLRAEIEAAKAPPPPPPPK